MLDGQKEGDEREGRVDVVIRLRIRQVEPLAGSAATQGSTLRAFEGWMELIGVIAELLGSPER